MQLKKLFVLMKEALCIMLLFLSRYLNYVYTSKTSKGLEKPSFLIFRREVAVNMKTAMEPLRNS